MYNLICLQFYFRIKAFLTETLLNPFHIREYYSGMPIINKSMPYLSESMNAYSLRFKMLKQL